MISIVTVCAILGAALTSGVEAASPLDALRYRWIVDDLNDICEDGSVTDFGNCLTCGDSDCSHECTGGTGLDGPVDDLRCVCIFAAVSRFSLHLPHFIVQGRL